MEPYRVTLLNREEVAEATLAFHFTKPEGFTFKPGQHLSLALIDPPEMDEEGSKRTFSIASAPHEANLMIATRMRSTAFKRVLGALPVGSEIKLGNPHGSMTFHADTTRPAVFLAGGIGITPFMSMTRHAAHAHRSHNIFLFYSNRRPEDAPFLKELEELQEKNPNYKLIATMTEMERSQKPWDGERGAITKEMVEKYLGATGRSIFYVAGPPQMVEAIRKVAYDLGATDDDIKTEEFAGYS